MIVRQSDMNYEQALNMALTIERGDTSRSKDPRDLCNRPCSKMSHGVHHNRGDGGFRDCLLQGCEQPHNTHV